VFLQINSYTTELEMKDQKVDLAATAEALNSGAVHLLRAVRAVDRQSGLTRARLSALSVLVFAGPRTLGRLAEAEDVSSATMTRIVDGLAALGLVVREPHPDSARLVRVAATEEGRWKMERARASRAEAINSGLCALDPEQQRLLSEAAPSLDQLATAVRAWALSRPGAQAG
jgi:DNA-binding MarR family transcriptional regulator